MVTPRPQDTRVAGELAFQPCNHRANFQQVLFPARDYISGDDFTLVRCRQCSLVRTSPHPAGDEKARYYPLQYYGDESRYIFPVEYVLHRLQTKRSRLVHGANGNRPGRVLDIGCGRGLLLNQLRALGWSATGTELSVGAAHYARDVLGLDVRIGDLESHDFRAESFDAVILWHVIEHVDDPMAVLHEVAKILRPGGFILLAAPNFGSVEARLCREGWFHLDVPRHLSHFTLETLLRVVQAEGFVTERIRYFSPEYDYFSFIQSTLNKTGVVHNSLYELLRAGPAKLLQRRGTVGTRDMLANVALAPFLGLLSVLAAPVVSRLGTGATMIILARKSRDGVDT